MRKLEHKLRVARGETPTESLFKNARLVNVFSGEIYSTNVAVDDGRVVGLGDYEAREVIDLAGAYLAPSLIDGHFHVESTMVTVPEFARAVVPHGTGAMVIDPHEFANVLGKDGIQYVLGCEQGIADRFFYHAAVVHSGDAFGNERRAPDRFGFGRDDQRRTHRRCG